MTKTLLTNGCSFTWGGGLEFATSEQRLETVWPGVLAQKLGIGQVNLSQGCGSNQRIFRTTLDWINQQSREILSDTLAIIQFTEPSRYEWYQPDYHNWARIKTDVFLTDSQSHTEADFELSQKRFEYYTDQEGTYSMLTYLHALKSVFDLHGMKHFFFGYTAWDFLEYTDYVRNNFSWLSHGGFMDMAREHFGTENLPWGLLITQGHLSIRGHSEFADYVYARILGE